MSEPDVFEARFTAAYRRYLDEVLTEVDAAAVARTVVAAQGSGWRRRSGWSILPTRAPLWVVLLVALLAAAGAAVVFVGANQEPLPQPAMLVSPAPVVTLAPAVLAPVTTPAPSATPIDVPPGVLSPAEAAYLRVPIVTPSALGRISWTVWLPSDTDSSALPLNTPHGPVILQGENLIWRLPSGTWKSAPILGTATWPGAALGDDLILTDTPLPARFHWTGSDWVRAGSVEGLEGFNGVLGLTAQGQAIVAFGPSGIASSSGGIRFVRALDGPSCVMSVTSTGDRFVALSGRCGLGTMDGILDSNKNAWFEPTPWTSTDGRSWQHSATVSPFGPGATVTGVASHGGRQVAIGVAPSSVGQDPAASTAGFLEPAAWVSDDGLAWRRLPGLPEPPCDPATCTDAGGAWAGFRTIVASDAGWLILSFGGIAWTSADGLTWQPLHDSPRPWFGYFPPLAAMSSDLIVMGSESSGQGGVDDPRFYHPVAIGTILGP